MKLPFNFAGQSGEFQSKQFGREITRNLYLVKSETSGKLGAIIFPGLKPHATGTGIDRGSHVMAGELYLINREKLYKESSNGSRTNLGAIDGQDRAIFADDGTNLMIVANNEIYLYNGTLTTVSQSVVSNPSSIDYINQQFVITGDDQKFAISDVDDPTSWNALNFDFEKTSPDPLFRVFVYKQLLYMCGGDSIVNWRNTGTGNPPVARQETSLVSIGITGKYAVTSTPKYLYFLGSDKKPYQVSGSVGRPINTAGISYIIESLTTFSDCICSSLTWKGQTFIMYRFPTDKATLLYSEDNNVWTELDGGTEPDSRTLWRGSQVTDVYGKKLTIDYKTGDTYELDENTYTDNGEARLWVKSLPSITGSSIKMPGRRIQVSGIDLNMQTGVGARIICQFSNNGGEVYSAPRFVSVGDLGEHTKKVQFDDFSNGYEVKARVMGSDPAEICIYGGEYKGVRDGGY